MPCASVPPPDPPLGSSTSAGSATRLAALDLGTNTVRLLVAEAAGSAWRALHEAQRVTRLGEGQTAAAGRLQEPAIRRTLETIAEFVASAQRFGISRLRMVATSAVREAPNRAEFTARVESATGQAVEVVSGEEEAGLTLLGVSAGLRELDGAFLLFDIGGGSTEFVLARHGRAFRALSLRLGVVRLAERFIDSRPVEPDRLALMRAELDARLAAEIPAELSEATTVPLVGTAGTVTTLAALDLALARYDAQRVHGHVLRRPAVEALLARTAALTLGERAALPCLEPGRADVLVPGIVICLAALARLRRESLIVSDWGLREGIVHQMLGV